MRAVLGVGSRRRGPLALLLVLGVAERLAALASGLAWGSRAFAASVAALVVVGVVLRPLRALERNASAALLLEATAARILTPRGLAVDLAGQDEPLTTLTQGAFRASRVLVDVALPVLVDAPLAVLVVAVYVLRFGVAAVGVGLVAALAGAIVLVVLRRAALRSSERAWRATQDLFDDFADVIDGRVDLVGAGASRVFLDQLSRRVARWRRGALRSDLVGAAAGRGPVLVAVLVLLVFVASGQLGGDLVASGILLASGLPTLAGVVSGLNEIAKARHELAPLEGVLSRPSDRPGAEVAASISDLCCDRVSFAYTEAPRAALEDVSIAFVPGLTVFAGANGSGKTTLLWVLAGLLTPTDGAVRSSAGALADLDGDAWRQRAAFLPQRVYLPPRRSVRAAIALTSRAPDARALAELERVGLRAVLEAKATDPLDASVDALSAGERQRLALARALARDADAYLLDEPDANLDAAGVKLVAKLLRELADAGKIVVVAAHTPELLEAADRVVHLEGGRVTRIEERRAPADSAARRGPPLGS